MVVIGKSFRASVGRADIAFVLAASAVLIIPYWITAHTYALAERPGWIHYCALEVIAALAGIVWAWSLGRRGAESPLFRDTSRTSRIDVAMSIVAAACVAVCCWPTDGGEALRFGRIVATMVSGIPLCWLVARLVCALGRLSDRRAVCRMFAASVVEACVCTLLSPLPAAVSTIVAVGFLLFMPWGLRYAANKTIEPEVPSESFPILFTEGLHRPLARPYILCSAIAFVYSAVNIAVKSQYGSYAVGASAQPVLLLVVQGALALTAALLLAWVLVFGKRFDVNVVLKVLTLLLSLAMVCVGVFGSTPWIQTFTFPMIELLDVFVMLMAADVIRHGSASQVGSVPFWAVLIQVLPYYAGRVLFQSMGDVDISTCLVLMVVLCVTVMFVLPFDPETYLLFSHLNGTVPEVRDYETIDGRCRILAQEKGLSDRELDLLMLLAKGKSKPQIAQELFLSVNTVKSYTRRLYTKLDIHSTEELQEALGI